MATTETREIHTERDRFLEQVRAHHRAGDYYPDPTVIASELRLTRTQTDTILNNLRSLGWIAASPYDPAHVRLTPRYWNALLHASESASPRAAA
jgi:hypothetical protein